MNLRHHPRGSPGAGRIAKIRIKIRDARVEDLDAVTDLWEELARHHEGLSERFSLALDGRRRWAQYLQDRFSEISTKLVVAEENGRIVGFMLCMLEPNVPVYRERKIGVISDVFVKQERRRKGVAKKMLISAVAWFRKNKVKTVRLNVAADNLEARAAWRMLGFEAFMIDKRLDLDTYESTSSRRRPVRVVHSKRKRKSFLRR